jgi:cell shape-determining protein MreC
MKSQRLFFYLLTAILLLIIFFLPSLGWKIRAWLSPSAPQDANTLLTENVALKAQLAQYAAVARALPIVPQNYIPAVVYSRYPTNFRNELLVNAGSNEGVAAGRAVVIEAASSSPAIEGGYVFVGKVQAVFVNTALVSTVFDPGFRMPVRIGAKGYDALFAGGAEPEAMSILKSAAVAPGDIVVSADPAFPYGLAVAEVTNASLSSDNLFQEASLDFPYDINAIQAVLIEK